MALDAVRTKRHRILAEPWESMRNFLILAVCLAAGVLFLDTPWTRNLRARLPQVSSFTRQGQGSDTDPSRSFARNELFAVMEKKTIPPETYPQFFDRNKVNTLPAIYILRCLGRETRQSFLLIVNREFFFSAKLSQKFTRAELSGFEVFLSEDVLTDTIFHRRFQDKMIKP